MLVLDNGGENFTMKGVKTMLLKKRKSNERKVALYVFEKTNTVTLC